MTTQQQQPQQTTQTATTTTTAPTAAAPTGLNAAYAAQRSRLVATVTAAAAFAWAQMFANRSQTIAYLVELVEAGQANLVRLVEAYMAAMQQQATGSGSNVTLDPARYTTSALRGLPAEVVYGRPFGAYGAFVNQDAGKPDAIRAAQASVQKLAATDLQLAQTHAAQDWMQATSERDQGDELRIVGYRRVLNPPSCKLCEAASTRTYRVADLMPIHEHCDCGVEPLWGTKPVASVGTTVRVEDDPEIGPRLMADTWSSVGPRLID